jgi:DNA polymerase I-like protein with 3'-5' exonuclease and polymerase domains
MKQAIVQVASRLPDGARIISTVHDELIVEAPESIADQVKEMVATTMREAVAAIFPQVPIEVEAKVCSSWGDK